MLKILFYNHTGQVGGAERLLLTLLQRLDRSRFAPVLVCPREGPLQELANQTGVKIETIDGLKARFTWRVDHLLRYLYSFAQVMLELRKRVIEVNPGLLHANSVRAGLVATVATFGLQQRVVWHVHDLLPRHPLNPFIRAIAWSSQRTRVVAVARASADRLVGKFAGLRNRLTIIPNAIDADKFHADITARQRIRNELKIAEDAPVIGMVGRLTPSKGQLELVRLFPKVLTRFPNARLVIAGAPAFNKEYEYAQLLERTIGDLQIANHVLMLGSREDVADIMQSLDVLVVNSASEACSLVILEAMACGKPVLATSTGGTPEIIEHRKTGWLVPWGNQDALIDGILNLIHQPELGRRLADEARRRVASTFSLERLMTDLHRFYLDTCCDPSALEAETSHAKIETADFA